MTKRNKVRNWEKFKSVKILEYRVFQIIKCVSNMTLIPLGSQVTRPKFFVESFCLKFSSQMNTIFFSSIRYHGSSSSIKCNVYHHVGEGRHTPVVFDKSRGPHASHYPSTPVTNKNTNYSYQPLSQSTGRVFFLKKNCNDIEV